MVYELSPDRMQRYQELFIDPEIDVGQLPPYEPSIASNPFKVFRALPPYSRYRFLLDDARFFIEGFIKGLVSCIPPPSIRRWNTSGMVAAVTRMRR